MIAAPSHITTGRSAAPEPAAVVTTPDREALPPTPEGAVIANDGRRASQAPGVERRRAPRFPRAQLFVALCHWAMVALLTLSLLTGMRIGWSYVASPLGGSIGAWGAALGAISPKGTLLGVNLITLHVVSAFGMLLVAGVYVGYLRRSRASRRLEVTGQDLRKLTRGIRAGGFWRNKAALWSANLLVYWASFAMIAVLILTGVALYRLDWGLSTVLGGYDAARLAHGIVAYLLVPYTILHVTLQWFFGRFWTIFKTQLYRPHVRAGIVSLALAVPVIVGLYVWNEVPETLRVVRTGGDLPAPVLDGDPGDAVWRQARAVTIRTTKGANNPRGHVDVTVKALHDGEQIYFQFQWDDANASYKRWPLIKTENGWKVLQTAFETWDENAYYEDKLSVYITDVRNGSCADTCHMGVGPYSARGEKHGLHYTRGEVGDLWQWKAVRTNPMGAPTVDTGFVDDMHFRGPDPVPAKLTKRYTAGYYEDPGGGGYALNFEKLDPGKPLSQTLVRPLFLPPSNGIAPNPDPSTSEHGVTWWIHRATGIPYTASADTYPVGTLIPNIVIAPFTGDRADIRGQAVWRQGRWTLETRRVLDTKSRYDVAFVPGKPVYITVATYNHTETRHTEHIRPVRVVLDP
jgi:Ethylbenzene dehydrogenase/Prokaryotic cytochrome b561